jgi:hypothetical protein
MPGRLAMAGFARLQLASPGYLTAALLGSGCTVFLMA